MQVFETWRSHDNISLENLVTVLARREVVEYWSLRPVPRPMEIADAGAPEQDAMGDVAGLSGRLRRAERSCVR